jgi:hypothetical protein
MGGYSFYRATVKRECALSEHKNPPLSWRVGSVTGSDSWHKQKIVFVVSKEEEPARGQDDQSLGQNTLKMQVTLS